MCVCVCACERACMYPSKRIHVAACGPIGTKCGTHVQIHLQRVVGQIKISRVTRGHLEVLWGKTTGKTAKQLDRLAPNVAHLFRLIWEWT